MASEDLSVIPEPEQEKENVDPKSEEKPRKKRLLPAPMVGEVARMMDHLKSAMMDEIRSCLELVREAMMDEVQQAVNNLWAKIRPILEDQSRSIAALAEAMDEMTIKEAENEAPRAPGNPQASGGPAVAEPLANQSPAIGRGSADDELLDDQSPPQGGGPIGNEPLANQAPARNARSNAGFLSGGRGGYGGEWRGRRRPDNGRGRLNFLFRQLEREVGGRAYVPHPYLEFRRGGGRRGNGPYNGVERGRGSYGRADRAASGGGQRGGH